MTEEVMFCGYCEETKKRREDDDDDEARAAIQTAGRNEEIIFDASTQLWSSEKKFHFSSRRLRKKIKASGDNDSL